MTNEKTNAPQPARQHETAQHADVENAVAAPGLVTPMMSSGAGVPLNRLPTAARQQTVLQLQRQRGNAYVQRLLRQDANVVQRATGVGETHSFKPPIKKWPVEKQLGKLPIKLKEVAVGADITVSSTSDKSADTQVKGGAVGVPGKEGGIGIQGEVEKTWDSKIETALGNIEFKSKGAAEVTTAGAKIGGELLTAALGSASVSFKIDVLKYDKEKSEFEFATAAIEAAYEVYKYETTLSDGTSCSVVVKPTLEFVFEPDYVAIAQWMAERYAQSAAAAIGGIGLGMIAAGFSTLAAAYVNMGLGKEISGRIEDAYKDGKEFAQAYQSAVRGEEVTINRNGGMLGMKAGDAVVKKAVEQDKVAPIEAFQQEARKRPLSEEAWNAGWPIIKQKALEAYREEHWFEWTVYGEDGPGYRTMVRLLEGFD